MPKALLHQIFKTDALTIISQNKMSLLMIEIGLKHTHLRGMLFYMYE